MKIRNLFFGLLILFSQVCLPGITDYFEGFKNKWHKEALIGGIAAKCLSCDMVTTGACILLANFGLEYLKNINQKMNNTRKLIDKVQKINQQISANLDETDRLRKCRLKQECRTKLIRLVCAKTDLESSKLNKQAYDQLTSNALILEQANSELAQVHRLYARQKLELSAANHNLDAIQKLLPAGAQAKNPALPYLTPLQSMKDELSRSAKQVVSKYTGAGVAVGSAKK